MAFRDGVLVYSQPGALPPAALEDLITRVKSLEMAEVRVKIAAEESRGEGIAEPSLTTKLGEIMCYPEKCPYCGKTGWAGCGQHVDEVMRSVPASQRCTCRTELTDVRDQSRRKADHWARSR